MGRRWKWFLRPGSPAIDLTGQVVPDGDVPGRNRRPAGEDVVLDVRMTSRCDRAVVYERPERRWTAPVRNHRVDRYDPQPHGERHNKRRGRGPAEGWRSDG